MSYSLDFRKLVFKIKDKENLSSQGTSDRFGVPIRTLFRWNNHHIEPKTTRNKPATKLNMEAFKKYVEDYPDSYQYERASIFRMSSGCIFHALKRLNISHKKKRCFIPKQMIMPELALFRSSINTNELTYVPLFT